MIYPNLEKTKTLTTSILEGYPDLQPKAATALVRSARLFQHGLWLCESVPNDAWLMLVSAIEVAAVHWRTDEASGDPEVLFRRLKPAWAQRLDATGDKTVTGDMAKHWADLLGATNRFIRFLLAHLPDAPSARPPFGQIDWTKKNLRLAFEKVYAYRSNALHAGTPFPVPMCSSPILLSHVHSAPLECPGGLAFAAQGGVWISEDLPMHLHMFVYIAQAILLKWWNGLKIGKEQEIEKED